MNTTFITPKLYFSNIPQTDNSLIENLFRMKA